MKMNPLIPPLIALTGAFPACEREKPFVPEKTIDPTIEVNRIKGLLPTESMTPHRVEKGDTLVGIVGEAVHIVAAPSKSPTSGIITYGMRIRSTKGLQFFSPVPNVTDLQIGDVVIVDEEMKKQLSSPKLPRDVLVELGKARFDALWNLHDKFPDSEFWQNVNQQLGPKTIRIKVNRIQPR